MIELSFVSCESDFSPYNNMKLKVITYKDSSANIGGLFEKLYKFRFVQMFNQ